VLAGGAPAAETTAEFWPELQVWWRLNPSTQLLFNPAPTHSKESDERTAVDWGLYLDYRVPKDPVSYRIVYGEPLQYHERFGPEGADDTRLVRYLANQVRRAVQLLIDRNRT